MCAPLQRSFILFFFYILSSLFKHPRQRLWVKREAVNFVVEFGSANEDANVLNVLAEAKNGDICPYDLVYLKKSASLLV